MIRSLRKHSLFAAFMAAMVFILCATAQAGISIPGSSGGPGSLVLDTSPQLGADLDTNGFNIKISNGKAIEPDTTDAHTFKILGYDVDGTAYKTFCTITNGNTPDLNCSTPAGATFTLNASTLQKGGSSVLAQSDLGTGVSTFLSTSVYNNSYMFLGSTGNGSTASENLGVGHGAIEHFLSTGAENTAVGIFAGYQITGGNNNTVLGAEAYYSATGQNDATVIGYNAEHNSTTAGNSVAVGSGACNVASVSQDICVGSGATVTTGISNAIAIGYNASAATSNTIQIGNSSITDEYIGTVKAWTLSGGVIAPASNVSGATKPIFMMSSTSASVAQQGSYVTMDCKGVIDSWDISVDAGTLTAKFWKSTSSTAVPTSSNSINTSGVSISSNTHVHSTTLSDFTSTTFNAGDTFGGEFTAVSGATKAGVQINGHCVP